MHKFVEKHWFPLLVLGAALLIGVPKADAKAQPEQNMPIMCDTYEANGIMIERCLDVDTDVVCYSFGSNSTSCTQNKREWLNKLYKQRKEAGLLNSSYVDEREPK